jgi:uncharacterized protein (DUF302 family)
MLYVKETTGSVHQVGQKVQDATVANKFGVMGVIDLKAKMQEKGVSFVRECLIIEVCNPVQAKKVLEGDMRLSTTLPCRIYVYQDGATVKVATLRPTVLLELFGDKDLESVARQVEDVMVRIIDQACS